MRGADCLFVCFGVWFDQHQETHSPLTCLALHTHTSYRRGQRWGRERLRGGGEEGHGHGHRRAESAAVPGRQRQVVRDAKDLDVEGRAGHDGLAVGAALVAAEAGLGGVAHLCACVCVGLIESCILTK